MSRPVSRMVSITARPCASLRGRCRYETPRRRCSSCRVLLLDSFLVETDDTEVIGLGRADEKAPDIVRETAPEQKGDAVALAIHIPRRVAECRADDAAFAETVNVVDAGVGNHIGGVAPPNDDLSIATRVIDDLAAYPAEGFPEPTQERDKPRARTDNHTLVGG